VWSIEGPVGLAALPCDRISSPSVRSQGGHVVDNQRRPMLGRCQVCSFNGRTLLNVCGPFEDDHALIILVSIFEGMIILGTV
jgi:hypothetical protein